MFGNGSKRFIILVCAAGWLLLGAKSYGQEANQAGLLQLLEQHDCVEPVYFAVERFYVGRVFLAGKRVKIQINNLGLPSRRNQFLKEAQETKDRMFEGEEPVHEFSTSGKSTFGSSGSDVYKGLERSDGGWRFGFRGSGEQLAGIEVDLTTGSGGKVKTEKVSALAYFGKLLIGPALEQCAKKD